MSETKTNSQATPWAKSVEATAEEHGLELEQGLTQQEAERRLEQEGKNKLRTIKRRSAFSILIDQFKSLIILLLAVAGGVSFAFGETIEGIAIVAVISINAAIGFFTELGAVRSMEALKKLGGVEAHVVRDGKVKNVSAENVVRGDLLYMEAGDLIVADIRLTKSAGLQIDESPLTGESVPVTKQTEALDKDTELPERLNMAYKGTTATSGSAYGVVIGTGMNTELGKISELVEGAEEEETPLEKRLDKMANKLIYVTLGVVVVTAVLGVVGGKDLRLMIETSIALAVAAIPEGLPIVATIALARGMWRMARRNALINRLSAVETLGATNVICTDKTGTLTENRMTVSLLQLASGKNKLDRFDFGTGADGGDRLSEEIREQAVRAMRVAVLCNNASYDPDGDDSVGDPMEVALLSAGRTLDLRQSEVASEYEEVREEPFDSYTRMMATYHRTPDGDIMVAVKGAPEAVLDACSKISENKGSTKLSDAQRRDLEHENESLAGEGLRLLATAQKRVKGQDEEPYSDLEFLGFIGLLDPPRPDVAESIQKCQDAGIRVIMVTGDQKLTAANIAEEVGLTDDARNDAHPGTVLDDIDNLSEEEKRELLEGVVFSRVSPKQKLSLVSLHQQAGSIVAMTGDGVNDAPALKKADIGIAMGKRGTDVARQASDMVLQDDAFPTIAAAVEQGRIIFGNIRKFVMYLLSCNVSEILTVGFASAVALSLPILPLQILFLNLVTDIFPAFALGVGPGSREVMQEPARDASEPLLTKRHWIWMVGYSTLITVAVLASMHVAGTWLGLEGSEAVTISFLTLAFAQLWHVFNMRSPHDNGLVTDVTRNPYVWGALVLCTLLLLLAMVITPVANVLEVTMPTLNGWFVVLGFSLAPTVVGQIALLIASPRGKAPQL